MNIFKKILAYLRQVFVELRKVSYPTRTQVIQRTIIVVVAIIIFVAIVAVMDAIFTQGIRFFILKQGA